MKWYSTTIHNNHTFFEWFDYDERICHVFIWVINTKCHTQTSAYVISIFTSLQQIILCECTNKCKKKNCHIKERPLLCGCMKLIMYRTLRAYALHVSLSSECFPHIYIYILYGWQIPQNLMKIFTHDSHACVKIATLYYSEYFMLAQCFLIFWGFFFIRDY